VVLAVMPTVRMVITMLVMVVMLEMATAVRVVLE
jgi:hypothetical protein